MYLSSLYFKSIIFVSYHPLCYRQFGYFSLLIEITASMTEESKDKKVGSQKRKKTNLNWEVLKLKESLKRKKRKIGPEDVLEKESTKKRLDELQLQKKQQKLFHHEKHMKQAAKKALTFELRSFIHKVKMMEKKSPENPSNENKKNAVDVDNSKGLKNREKVR
jgi:hypothetical protein